MGRAGETFCAMFVVFWGLFIAGLVVLPLGVTKQNEAKAADMDKDFPPMSNGMTPPGTCKVLRLWFRSVLHKIAVSFTLGCTRCLA